MKNTNADKNCAFEMEKKIFSMTQVKITVEKKCSDSLLNFEDYLNQYSLYLNTGFDLL